MITIKEIAKKAGVSMATVSRLLNDDETLFISVDKKELILDIVNKHGYKIPKNRKSKKEIAIISWQSFQLETADSFYAKIRQSVEQCAITNKYGITIVYAQNNTYDLSNIKGVDGIVAIGKFSNDEISLFNTICPNIIFVDSSPLEELYSCVVINYNQGMNNALDYVINEIKATKITYIGGNEYTKDNQLTTNYRLNAFNEYFTKHNLKIEHQIYLQDYSFKSGYDLMNQLIIKEDIPQVIIAANELLALGILKSLYENEIKVPKQVQLLCFSGMDETEYLAPALTCVQIPTTEMGQYAFDLVSNAIKQTKASCKIMLSTELIIRDSTKNL
ncbi:MAG: LacI family DNA-binding transcriptional regulator [Bacilli bacterium]